jgi:hypothetical protein
MGRRPRHDIIRKGAVSPGKGVLAFENLTLMYEISAFWIYFDWKHNSKMH